LAGSGSALKSRIRIPIMWKVGSESASIKNLNPDPHQIKIRIRIRIKMIRSYRTMYTFYVSFSFTCLVFYLFWSVTEPDLDSAVQSVWLWIPDPEGAERLDLFQKCFFSCLRFWITEETIGGADVYGDVVFEVPTAPTGTGEEAVWFKVVRALDAINW
jgi:hypothetical protein